MNYFARLLVLCGLVVAGGVFFLMPTRLAQGQKGDGKAASAVFDFRFTRVGDGVSGIRYKAKTGESWLITNDGWQRIPETAKVPPADYDVILAAKDNDFFAFRIDRVSGAAWQMRAGKWEKVGEQK